MSDTIRHIQLLPYDPHWAELFLEEAENVKVILGSCLKQIEHIGSTAIPGIYAKPVIDILVAVSDIALVDDFNSKFEALGYACKGEFGLPGRRFFMKGEVERSHQIHVFELGHSEVKRHCAFRDFMKTHPDEARAYSWIKRCLAEQFPNDIQAYISGKNSFIRMMDYRAGCAQPDQYTAKDDIRIEPPNADWPFLGKAELSAIQHCIDLPYAAMEHLGSTSIAGLSAKPIIDIFVALHSIDEADRWVKPLEALGYDYWVDNPNPMHRRFFKGMPPFGVARTHHLHIMPMGDDFKRRVQFRDILNREVALRQAYEALKHKLAADYSEDREMYSDKKGEFVKQVLADHT